MSSGLRGHDARHTEKPQCVSALRRLQTSLWILPRMPTHRRRLPFTGGSPLQTLIQVFSAHLPAGLLCHVYPDSHSPPLRGFSSSSISKQSPRGQKEPGKNRCENTQRATTENPHASLQKGVSNESSSAVGPHSPSFDQGLAFNSHTVRMPHGKE